MVMDDHKRYSELAEELSVEAGFVVLALDQQGHGKSGGKRGYVGDFKDYVRDTCEFMAQISPSFLALPKFIIG